MSDKKPLKDYKPGDLVLSTCVPYDPWPAVVLPFAYVPNTILKSKKNNKICVKYINDPDYYWNTEASIQPLTKQKIKEFENSDAKSKKKEGDEEKLIQAYKEAKQYNGNLEAFLRSWDLIDDDDEYIDYANWSDIKEKPAKKVKKNVTKQASTPNKSKARSVEQDNNNDVQKNSKSQNKKRRLEDDGTTVPKSETPLTLAQKKDIAIGFRSKLQRALLQREGDPTDEELRKSDEDLKDLEEFHSKHYINTDVLKASKLHKVLKAIHKVENLERSEDFKFHKRCEDLLLDWDTYVQELKSEKHQRVDNPNSSFIENNNDVKDEEVKDTNKSTIVHNGDDQNGNGKQKDEHKELEPKDESDAKEIPKDESVEVSKSAPKNETTDELPKEDSQTEITPLST